MHLFQNWIDNEIKELGQWTNEGECQVVGENKVCAPGLRRQVRSCKDGITDKCTEQETFRLFPCRQNETEILCEGNQYDI